ncbi:uncharacterized protein K460DRAFT_253634, partial [Cucurbitaria berberidis CBS 394.84]
PLPPVSTPRLQFANGAQALLYKANRTVPYDWQAPQSDDSIPHDDERRGLYVRQLFAAFLDNSESIDSEKMADWSSAYTEQQIEIVCWKMVGIAEALHTRGPISLGVYDQAKLKLTRASRNLLFSGRITQICQLLRLSKFRCESMMDFEGLEMCVATPDLLISQTKINKRLNAERQKTLVEGRKAMKGKGK